jgi:gamma-glutamylcyclotransferase (GGCT)/AIG2-like uncharacterized protein YtfP
MELSSATNQYGNNEDFQYVAVYGTLRKGYGNHRLLNDQEMIGTGKTDNLYTMYASGIPYVTEDQPTHNVTIELYKVANDRMRNLDSLEGHPTFYERKLTPVTVDGKTYQAWLYFCDGRGAQLVESGDYTDYRKLANAY